MTPVFLAGSIAEIDFAEKLLEREGIEYSVRPYEFTKAIPFAACYQGLLFEVLAGQASYCRKLFADAGLERGVVKADELP